MRGADTEVPRRGGGQWGGGEGGGGQGGGWWTQWWVEGVVVIDKIYVDAS